MKFSDIEFGSSAGETEGAYHPQLLKNAYINYKGMYEKVESGSSFLVLGRKGCGKSTIAEKLRLEKEEKSVSIIRLQEFPFRAFKDIYSEKIEQEARYPTTWSWLLLLAIVDQLRYDKGAKNAVNIDYNKAIQKLDNYGLLSSSNLKDVVIKSSRKEFKVQLPKIIEFTYGTSSQGASQASMFKNLVEFLKNMIINYSTEGGLILIIDGLDDVLTTNEIQYQVLSALVIEVERLNLFFKINNKKIHIVVLCRTELYEDLPNPNKNKIRRDFGVELSWFQELNPKESKLIELINLRAKLSIGDNVDVFEEFFPKKIRGKDTLKYLIDMTRHTPRDLINLMNCLKEIDTGKKFTENEIFQGLKEYSINYFEPEIRDEVVGYVDIDSYDKFCEAVRKIKQKEFSYATIQKECQNIGFLLNEKLRTLLKVLYDCGAIGNKWGDSRYEFKFRNKNSFFDPSNKMIVLHRGLWKALNLN